MEIIVRKNDLVKELHARPGHRRAQELDPDPLERPRRGAGAASCASPPPTSTSRCAAAARRRWSPRAPSPSGPRSSTRSRARCPRATCTSRCCPTPGPPSSASACSFKMAGLPTRGLPGAARGQAGKGASRSRARSCATSSRAPRFAITAEDARYYLAGALLVLDKDGRGHGGHRRAPALLRAAQGRAQGHGAAARARSAQGDPRARRGCSRTEEAATFQQVENHLVFTVGGRMLASKMIEGQFPAFEKVIAVTGDKDGDARPRAAGHGHPPREPALLGAQPRGEAQPRARASSSWRPPRPTSARPRESLTAEYKGATRGDRLQRAVPPGFPGRGGHGRRCPSSSRTRRARGMLRPAGEGETDYRYVVMPMRL